MVEGKSKFVHVLGRPTLASGKEWDKFFVATGRGEFAVFGRGSLLWVAWLAPLSFRRRLGIAQPYSLSRQRRWVKSEAPFLLLLLWVKPVFATRP